MFLTAGLLRAFNVPVTAGLLRALKALLCTVTLQAPFGTEAPLLDVALGISAVLLRPRPRGSAQRTP